MEVNVTFLGTGTSQGVPMIGCKCEVCQSSDPRDKRLRSSILVEAKGKTIVVDTGPDFRYQMLREKVDKLDAVLFTHEHKDHLAGLDDVRAFNYIQRKDMEIFASEQTQVAIKRDFYYAFGENKYPGVPQLNLNTISNEPFIIFDIPIIPIQLIHYKMPVFGFRFGNFAYLTDANYIAPEELAKLQGVEVMVINALRKEKHVSHFSLDEAIEIIDEVKPKMAYLTHFSHQMGKYVDVVQELPDHIRPAYDGLKVSV